ncbi:MAG: TraB/GumN family protein [Pseudomonadota bacterium]
MRKTMLGCVLAVLLSAPVQAQQAQAVPPVPAAQSLVLPDDGIRTEATVVVTGEQPGPGLWLVRKGGNELYILGTLNPLPANMQLSSSNIDAVISRAQEVIRAPSLSVGTDASKLRLLMLAPSLIGIRNNPDRKTLKDVMPSTLYMRWQPFKQRFLPGDDKVEKMRPMFAAQELYKSVIKRSGMSSKDPSAAAVTAAIEKYHPSVSVVRLELKVKDPKAVVKQMKSARFDDLACMERTLDRLGVDMEVMRLRANAWATGDIATLRANPVASQSKACMDAVTESAIGERIGMGNAEARVRAMWLAKVEQALAKNTTTFAILPMDELLDAGGSLDALRRKGYTVLAPDE